MVKVAPSILSANFGFLSDEVESVLAAGADYIHFDVMDGLFVPNISFGVPVLKSLRSCTSGFIDAHLMIDRPIRYIDDFCKAGADLVSIHVESDSDVNIISSIKRIHSFGRKAGIALNPQTPAEDVMQYISMVDLILVMTVQPGFGGQSFMYDQLEKIRKVSQMIKTLNPTCELEIDGGLNDQTAIAGISAGADVIVAGSYIFSSKDRKSAVDSLRKN